MDETSLRPFIGVSINNRWKFVPHTHTCLLVAPQTNSEIEIEIWNIHQIKMILQ